MRRKLRFFHQHTERTCGISCILMLLDKYRRVQYPTVKMEYMLYGGYQSRAFMGVPGSFAADCLSWNWLQVQLLHSSPDMMENREEYFEETLFQDLQAEYRLRAEACRNRVEIRTGETLDCRKLKDLLTEGRQILVQCIVPGNADGIHTHTLHWVLVYGYDGERFLVCDPNYGKIRIPDGEMEGYMDSPIGRIFVTVREMENLKKLPAGKTLDVRKLKDLLAEGKQVLVRCIVPGNAYGSQTLHWGLVYGHDGERFLAWNPDYRTIRVPDEKMEGYLTSSAGRIFVTDREKK